jgi:hypothetical protein
MPFLVKGCEQPPMGSFVPVTQQLLWHHCETEMKNIKTLKTVFRDFFDFFLSNCPKYKNLMR